ncbi:hypothetical protein ADL08_12935, partial [Streptomyces sp. NRRL F-6492]
MLTNMPDLSRCTADAVAAGNALRSSLMPLGPRPKPQRVDGSGGGRTPPYGQKGSIGGNGRAVVMPTAAAEPVRLRTSQSWVIRAIHVPVLE